MHSEIISKPSPFTKVKLKWPPYRETVVLESTFVWNSGEIEDRAKISTEFFFWEIVE